MLLRSAPPEGRLGQPSDAMRIASVSPAVKWAPWCLPVWGGSEGQTRACVWLRAGRRALSAQSSVLEKTSPRFGPLSWMVGEGTAYRAREFLPPSTGNWGRLWANTG